MTLLPEVRRQIHEAAQRRARLRRIPGSLRASPRSRRGIAVVVIAVLGTSAAAYGAIRLAEGTPDRYANAALDALVSRDPACATMGIPGTTSQGSPSRALLSMLAVLRRPATPGDAFPPQIARAPRTGGRLATGRARPRSSNAQAGRFGVNVYVRYIRRARIAYGAAYYIVPSGAQGIETSPPARCTAELQRDLPRMPAPLRAAALKIVAQGLADERKSNQPHESVCLTAVMLAGVDAGDGTGGCGASPAQILRGDGLLGTSTGAGGSTVVSAVVPDGVASVELSFSAPGAGAPRILTTNARPVNNVLVTTVPRDAAGSLPQRMVWRSNGGGVLKTITLP